MLWAVLLLMSSLASAKPIISLRFFFLEAIVFPSVFFLVVNRMRTRNELLLAMAAVVGYSALRILLSYYFAQQSQSLAYGGGLVLEPRGRAYHARVMNSDILADLALSTLPLSITLALLSSSTLKRFVFCTSTLFLLLVILWANTRSVVVVLVLTSPMIALYRGRRQRRLPAGLILTLVGVTAVVLLLNPPHGRGETRCLALSSGVSSSGINAPGCVAGSGQNDA